MTKPPETLTIGTTTYRVQMGTFTASLIGPRGGRYTRRNRRRTASAIARQLVRYRVPRPARCTHSERDAIRLRSW